MKKSEVYSGTISYRKDFWDFSPYPSKLKPMRKFGSSSGYFLINTENNAKQISIWKVVNPLLPNASLSVASTITLGNYVSISEAVQKGTTNKVDIGDHSISDVVCMDGYLYGAYKVKNSTSNGSMIVYFKVNTNNNFNLEINGTIETPNKYYYYPVIHPDNEGNIAFVFNKSSSDDFIGVAWTVRYAGNSNIESIQWLKQGNTGYYHLLNDRNRWGDYCGIALDPSNSYRIWICGEWAKTDTEWSTWIGQISTGQTVDFTFTNTIYDEDTGILNANAGGTLNVNSIPVNSGNPLPLVQGNPYTVKTNNERFPNWNSLGYTYKHKHWNSALNEKFLSYNLEASSNTNQKAFFKSLNYAKIAIYLEGQIIQDKGGFEFQDPWYVKSDGTQPGNYWIPCLSSYEPNGKHGATEKGVFLNQSGPGSNWQPPYYSVQAISPQDISLSQTGKTHRFYFQNWTGTNVNFQYANNLTTGVVFTNDNAIASANFKGTQLSDQSASLESNGQRKVIKTQGNELILAYEDLGKIWLEISTDNGITWTLLNDGKPVSTGTSKQPAIAQVGQSQILVVFQQLAEDEVAYSIHSVLFDVLYNQVADEKTIVDYDNVPGKSYSDDATPVISAITVYGIQIFLITWYETDYEVVDGGLYYCFGTVSSNEIQFSTNAAKVTSTTINSINPSISSKPNQTGYPVYFQLVWQENGTTTSDIKYREITYNGQQVTFGTMQVLSSGSGYTYNRYPSTTVMNDNIPRVTWQGERTVINEKDEEEEDLGKIQSTTTEKRVLFTDPSVSYFWGFGYNVGKPNINRTNYNISQPQYQKYYMAWSEPYESSYQGKSVDNTLSSNNIKTLSNLNGTEIQVSNGATDNDMYAISLNNVVSLPYYFQVSSVNPEQIGKEKFVLSGIGREGVVYKDTAQFYFMIGDVNVNDNEIDFVEIPHTAILSNDSLLNRYMQTENFTLNNTSEFLYSVQYGITDSMSAVAYLQNGNSVTFAVELVDANTGALLGRFDEVTYNAQNIFQYNNLSYEVNTDGIGNREVYLRLVTATSGEASYSLTNKFADESLIAKRHTKKINYTGLTPVTEYALSQNYPNPFNPVTTINYQIPKDGFVSLKVYDILGKEIATLVNSEKAQGKYTVEFDGSRFASGMYIYKLQSGDFVETRKMMLLK